MYDGDEAETVKKVMEEAERREKGLGRGKAGWKVWKNIKPKPKS